MNEPVTDVIVARAAHAGQFKSPLLWSILAHGLAIAILLLAPARRNDDVPRAVMTISLGGAAGPRAGGLTQMGGQSVPPPAPKPVTRPQARPVPPAEPPKAPAAPRTRPSAQARPTRPEARSAPTPPASTEPAQDGSTRVNTGARGQGFGLATGGGGSRGMELDVANFCCPEYLEQLRLVIERSWDRNQGAVGATVMKFTIHREGAIEMVSVERSSGFYALDNAAMRALVRAARAPALPAQFPNPTLTVHMRFEY